MTVIICNNNIKTTQQKTYVQWNKYHYYLKQTTSSINLLHTNQEIDQEINTLTEEINKALQDCSKTIELENKRLIILPVRIRQLIKDKRKAKKRAQRILHPDDVRNTTQLNNQVHAELRKYHNDLWNEKMTALNTEQDSVWKLAKRLKTNYNEVPPLHGRNGIGYTAEDKAEILADSIENQCTLNDTEDDDVVLDQVDGTDQYIRNLVPMPIRNCTYSEITTIINQLKIRKAPSIDKISNAAVKRMPRKCIVKLVNILNACLRNNYFPKNWKQALIITIPKPGKNHEWPKNHRPISLLPTFSKILEKVILTRLQNEIEELQIIPQEQFGFRKGHSTTLQALRLVEEIHNGFQSKDVTAVAFLDIAKAFDRIWHDALLHKMSQASISPPVINIIQSFLSNRSFRVKLQNLMSTPRSILAGVPQGSVLGPTLYSLFIHDIPRENYAKKVLFADDTAIFAQSRNSELAVRKLQNSLNNLTDWLDKWKIGINEAKTQAVLYTRKRNVHEERLDINGTLIRWSNQAKYLGLQIDQKLTWCSHTNYIKTLDITIIRNLYPLLANEVLDIQTKRKLYTTIIRPALTYCATIWGCAAKTHLKKIQVIQNKALRTITKVLWFVSNKQLHRELKIPTILQFIKPIATKTFQKAEEHVLIQPVINYNPAECRTSYRRPRLIELLNNNA